MSTKQSFSFARNGFSNERDILGHTPAPDRINKLELTSVSNLSLDIEDAEFTAGLDTSSESTELS